jgi:hypothetical protein
MELLENGPTPKFCQTNSHTNSGTSDLLWVYFMGNTESGRGANAGTFAIEAKYSIHSDLRAIFTLPAAIAAGKGNATLLR